jgi:hypothetical protein
MMNPIVGGIAAVLQFIPAIRRVSLIHGRLDVSDSLF